MLLLYVFVNLCCVALHNIFYVLFIYIYIKCELCSWKNNVHLPILYIFASSPHISFLFSFLVAMQHQSDNTIYSVQRAAPHKGWRAQFKVYDKLESRNLFECVLSFCHTVSNYEKCVCFCVSVVVIGSRQRDRVLESEILRRCLVLCYTCWCIFACFEISLLAKRKSKLAACRKITISINQFDKKG